MQLQYWRCSSLFKGDKAHTGSPETEGDAQSQSVDYSVSGWPMFAVLVRLVVMRFQIGVSWLTINWAGTPRSPPLILWLPRKSPSLLINNCCSKLTGTEH